MVKDCPIVGLVRRVGRPAMRQRTRRQCAHGLGRPAWFIGGDGGPIPAKEPWPFPNFSHSYALLTVRFVLERSARS